jgi:diguanylate cyclase (GGDEF)-like protein
MAISIKTKVSFPVLLLSLMMAGLVLAAWYALNETTRLNSSLASRFHEIEKVRQIETLFSNLVYPHLDYITTYSPEAKNEAHKILREIRSVVDSLNNMEAVNEEEREISELITGQLGAIEVLSEQVLDNSAQQDDHAVHSQTGKGETHQHDEHASQKLTVNQVVNAEPHIPGSHSRDMALINEIAKVHIARVRDGLTEWHASEAEEVDELANKTRDQLRLFTEWMLLFAIAAALMFVFSLWLNNRVLIRPVLSLIRSTNLFAAGDLKQQARVYAEDELGNLTRDINKMATALDGLYTQMATLAKTDQLTGLMNRHGLEEIQAREVSGAKRYVSPLSLAVFDIDHFKKVNDNYGHDVGDKVIQAVGNVCKQVFRDCDYSFRYGGEEFVVLMPQTDITSAMGAVERLRKAVEEMRVEASGGRVISVTVSVGIAAYQKDDETGALQLKHADEALYQAKESGRNRSVAYSA